MTTVDDRTVDIGAACHYLQMAGRPVPASTLRVWASRGKLARCGYDERGRSLYRLTDLIALATVARDRLSACPHTGSGSVTPK